MHIHCSGMQSTMMVLPALVVVLLTLGSTMSLETYSDKYDNVNVDVILHSDRLLNRYIACVLDYGPCSPDGRYFRTILPDALATNCAKCTDKMKGNVRKMSNHIMKRRPEDWAKFVQKYDIDGKYKESFARFLNEQS
ncbi:ejaculatory bulb-specific protein 3-like isoform X1 [Neodiprion fabricii]|uniref:ejaculatory bulb-specific protein 3-like isoform X1 n=2 Tax=Neodiprion fabricii TaxID=2872261 RepID=UPI001ED92486|nr:ejaculatory bulb-specific protein 3-like isoform X1 [Neodiprion fabricii]